MKTDEILVSIENLSFSRGRHQVLSGVSLSVKKGKITAIMGPSGCGKTTLLKLIGAELTPSAGRVFFNQQDVHSLSKKHLYDLRKQMGMLFQSGALFSDLSVYENVAFPLREHTDLSEALIRDIVLMKLEAVGLRGTRHLMPKDLSGGMTRRVALARAIALDPALMMYDEPFAGQDPISMAMLLKLIKQLNLLLGTTTIIVSHDVHETLSIADEVYLLSESKIIAHGTPTSLLETDKQQVLQFIKGLPDGPMPFHYPAKSYTKELLE